MDEYEVLGVDEGAEVDEIRKAYARAVDEVHPDGGAAGGSKEEFERVQEAYEMLMERYAYPSEEGRKGSRTEVEEQEYETEKSFKFGWEMRRTPDRDFYVTHDDEDAYIDPEGRITREPTYFNTSMEANIGFSRFLKHRKERLKEKKEKEESRSADDDDTETADDTATAGKTKSSNAGWSSSQVERRIDGFWHLTYQESEPMGEERRWAVYCRDKHVYVAPDGAASKEACWFETKDEALSAFEKHLEQADEVETIHLPLTLLYAVFVLPVKFVEMVLRTPFRLLGSGTGRQVPYVAEGIFLFILVGVAFWINWWLGVVAIAQLGTVFVYWSSPYEAHGPAVRPRWMRRNREVHTYDPRFTDD